MKFLITILIFAISLTSQADTQFKEIFRLVKQMEGEYVGHYKYNQRCYLKLTLQNRFDYQALVTFSITREDGRKENHNIELADFIGLLSKEDSVYKWNDHLIKFKNNLPNYVRIRYLRDTDYNYPRSLECSNLEKLL